MSIPWEAGEQGMKRMRSRSERGLSPISQGRLKKYRCPKCGRISGGYSPKCCPYCRIMMREEGYW